MKKKIFTIAIFCVVFIIIALLISNIYSPLRKVNLPQPIGKQALFTTTLDNGLTITIKQQQHLPLVTLQFWVKVGSKNENDINRGAAHIFEHIFFKGSKSQKTGEFLDLVESVGGDFNAMTSFDWTAFYIIVPSDKLDFIFPYFTDLLLDPGFDQEEIEKELQVILEEQRIDFNEPKRFTVTEFGKVLIDEHPYKHPIIGYKNTIEEMTREEIIKFYETWYVPNNINIVIVGDVDKAHILNKISNTFKDFKPKPLPILDLPTQKIHTEQKYENYQRNIGSAYTVAGYIIPDARHEDIPTLKVLSKILVEGTSSRLEKILKREQNTAVDVIGGVYELNDFGIFMILLTCDPTKKSSALAETLKQINKLKTELITDKELETGKMLLISDISKKRERIERAGFEIGEMWIKDTLNNYDKNFYEIQKVTKEDIKKVAQKYLIAPAIFEAIPK